MTLSVGAAGTSVADWMAGGGTVALAILATIALYGLWDATKTRHGELVVDLSRRWDEERVVESVMLMRKHQTKGITEMVDQLWSPDVTVREQADLELWYKLCLWPNLIETIGVFISEGVVSPKVVYKQWAAGIMVAWNTWQKPMERLREHLDDDEVFKYFQVAADTMKELDDKAKNPPQWIDTMAPC